MLPTLQRKVLQQFHAMRDDSWHVVDATQPIDAIQQQLRVHAAAVIASCQQEGRPLKRLWEGVQGARALPLKQVNQ